MSNLQQQFEENEFETKLAYLTFSEPLIDELKNDLKLWKESFEGKKKLKTKEQGDILEQLIYKMIKSFDVFKIVKNGRSSTNEIDIVIAFNTLGRVLKKEGYIPNWFPEKFIIECKNYKDTVDVTFVGKFYSLMKTTSSNFGIIISFAGITGRDKQSWCEGTGLIKKLFLQTSNNPNPLIILDIDYNLIDKMLEKKNFFEFLDDEKLKLECDIKKDFETYVKPHPLENKLT